jgi:hypothetical protein
MNLKIRKSSPVLTPFGLRPSDFGFSHSAYLLIETLVYMAVLFIVLGLGYALMYRSIDNFMILRRNADDIAHALRAGEQWRADVRSAAPGQWETNRFERTLHLALPRAEVAYRFSEDAVFRRVGLAPWVQILSRVKSSSIAFDPRQKVMPCKWELELQPRVNSARVRPLFTFIAVPKTIQ